MAPRRDAESVEEEPQLRGLVFNEPLSWRAGKPIATGVILKRLGALSNELQEMDQEEIDKDSLTEVAKELAGQNLLGHKDKGVRAFTACCLVDILKLCAPDAPYSGSQLKDIFTFFITSILLSLSDPSNAYNTQHKYVLVSLAEVKSIVLLTDIPGSDGLILHLFTTFFDIISGSSKGSTEEQIAKDVEYNMSQILVTLVDETPALPVHVVDVVVAQFLRASTPAVVKGKRGEVRDEKQSTLLPKDLPEAYNMAKTICNSCPEKMARYVSQYFNEVILDASPGAVKGDGHRRMSEGGSADLDEEEDEQNGPSEADMKELAKAHRLLRELWRASPAVLQNVIPQLEAELSAENIDLRELATETLGDIISGIGAAGPPPPPVMDPAAYPLASLEDSPLSPVSSSILTTPISPQSFATTHPTVYNSFLGRKNDKSSVIRSAWTTAVGWILATSAGGIGLSQNEEGALVRGLGEKLNDADEKVRLAAVKAVGGFSFRDIMTKLAPNGSVSKSGSVLCSLADRARDRKHAVRVEGMTTLSRMWGVAAGEIAAGNENVIEALGNIPSKVFDAYYANDLDLNILLDRVMFEQLIPLSYPPTKAKRSKAANGDSQTPANGDGLFDAEKIRTERILLVVKSLDTKSLKAFFAMQARQPVFSNVLRAFLQRCEEFNGGENDGSGKDTKAKLDAVIKWLSDLLPDPSRTSSELQKYAKLHDRRSYQLLRFAMDPTNDFRTVYNAIKEFTKRIEGASGAPAGLMETLTPIIYRSASLVYNRSHQPVILQYTRSNEKGLGTAAQKVMSEISEKHPQIFKANVKELSKALIDQSPSKWKANDQGSVETLKALASFAKNPEQAKEIPQDRKFTQALLSFALYATPPKAAKYAVSVLMASTERKEMHAKDLLEKATTEWEYGSDNFLTKLATISQLTLLGPKTTEEVSDVILDITIQQVLLKTRTEVKGSDLNWQSDGDVDEECQAKCWALKTLVNRLRSTENPETAKRLAVPVYKLLNTLIFKEGELSKNNDTPIPHKNRLRLLASQCMLKLCTKKIFDELLSPVEFYRLAVVAQDKFAQIRHSFVEKLQKYIIGNRLSNRFLTIMFLTAFEPDQYFSSSIVTWIRSRVKISHISKSRVFESVFPRLLHLLAHHPDYISELDDLRDSARYILHYLNTVASEDNIALIYKYAERVKQARDAISSDSDSIYVLSDLAQSMIRIWLDKKGWSMQTWPVKVGMPIGLFAGLPSHEVAQEIAERNYLPEGMDDLLEELVRTSGKKTKKQKQKRKSDDGDDGQPSKKFKPSRTSKSAAIKKERVVKPSKTPKSKKAASAGTWGTPAQSSVDRRKSERGASAKKSYVDRDDSEDDEEMMDGVASWDYGDGTGPQVVEASEDESEPLSTGEEEEVVENPTPTPEVETEDELEPEPEPGPEEEEEPGEEEESGEEEEVKPTPLRSTPRSNGKKAPTQKANSSVKKPRTRAPSARVTKSKTNGSLTLNAKSKSPVAKPKGKAPATRKGKGKAASKAKTVFDMDESE